MDFAHLTRIVEIIALIEIILLVLIIFATYFAKFYLYLLNKRKQKLIAEIENHLSNLMNSNQAINSQKFPRRWKKIQILYPILAKFDKNYKATPSWETLRKDLLQNIMLPLARRKAYSRRWILRFFSCETLAAYPVSSDEKIIIRLIKDRIPLVYLHAIMAAIKFNSETAINEVITRMSKMSWLAQEMYIEPFAHAAQQSRSFVEKRLMNSSEPLVRAECYKILRKFPPAKISWDINKDLQAKEFELRLSALKYLAYVDGEAAVPVLQDKLTDDHWEIRLVALHRLGKLKLQHTLNAVAACLTDSDWWVKLSAAHALKNFGDEGKKLLKDRAPDLENVPFETTEHLSKTLW